MAFRHKRVVFGLTSSPFLLGAVLEFHFSNLFKKIDSKEQEKWPRSFIEKLSKSFYVDNCPTSVKTTTELHSFISTTKDVMATGGFDLRGWEFTGDSDSKYITLVLGVSFNKVRDTLSINPAMLNQKTLEIVTKREILSAAQKVFDPIGFTSPVTLIPKLLLKKLWKDKIDWDSPVSDETRNEFLKWFEEISCLR